MVRSLQSCTKGRGLESIFKPVIKCEKRIGQLSVSPGKKAKVVTSCGHVERKDQCRTARLVYLLSGPYVLST